MLKKMDKRGLSEIIAYAIMIAIAIGLAVAVFGMWKIIVDGLKPPLDCKDGTSVILEGYTCPTDPTSNLVLSIKNNGGFNVNGVVVKVSYEVGKEPTEMLPIEIGVATNINGTFTFSSELQPGDPPKDATYEGGLGVKLISVQPFVFNDNMKKIVCKGFKEEINC